MNTKDSKEELREEFFSRWSRLKEEARQAPPQQAPENAPENAPEKVADPKAPAPELPPLDQLTFDSDYRAFFHPKVGEDVRRAALKKLFSDPRFNVMDGLDVYIDDYSKSEPIPPEMMATLRQAQKILAWAKEDEEQRKKDEAQQVAANQNQALEPPAAPSPSEIGFEEISSEGVPAEPEGASKSST